MTEAHGAAAPAHPPEIPNLITLITHWMPEGPAKHFLHTWENALFAFVIVGLVGLLMALAARRVAMRPGRGQMLAEIVVEGLEELVCGVLGKEHGRRFLPFLGTLFLFILTMNLAGLVPGLKSPTSRFEMTFSLALCVFWLRGRSHDVGYRRRSAREARVDVGCVEEVGD
jgi:F-type H+-transporting ATPase subunit a